MEMMAKVRRLEQHKGSVSIVYDIDVAKMSRMNCEWCGEKIVSEVLRKYDVCVCVGSNTMFLTVPRQRHIHKTRS